MFKLGFKEFRETNRFLKHIYVASVMIIMVF